jgi:salicylate hydroxylase
VTASRTVIVAGAGIGGMTAAFAVARKGFRAVVLEQTERLEETGAGIQLSPNATRILLALGLGERLRPHVVVPEMLQVLEAPTAREIVAMPLGPVVEQRFGAPYWTIHRGDLQAGLADAVGDNPDIVLRLGTRVEEFAAYGGGVTVAARRHGETADERGIALVAADGLWSSLRPRLMGATPPRFRRRSAWRALVPCHKVDASWREPAVRLWLGHGAHLVHYPVKGGAMINVVAIVDDAREQQGWSEAGDATEIFNRFAPERWAAAARKLIGTPERWLRWALYDRPPTRIAGRGAVTLVGDAAHPMLPFLAQGAAMAIEDATVLAECLTLVPGNAAAAMRRYESLRYRRNAKVQRAATRTGAIYHFTGVAGVVRNLVLRKVGGPRLLALQHALYDWRPPHAGPALRAEPTLASE